MTVQVPSSLILFPSVFSHSSPEISLLFFCTVHEVEGCCFWNCDCKTEVCCKEGFFWRAGLDRVLLAKIANELTSYGRFCPSCGKRLGLQEYIAPKTAVLTGAFGPNTQSQTPLSNSIGVGLCHIGMSSPVWGSPSLLVICPIKLPDCPPSLP